MERLFLLQKRLLGNTSTKLVRDCMQHVAWDERLSAIVGPRGVGKTTLMLQYIKLHFAKDPESALYASTESLYFTDHTLMDLAESFVVRGGSHLFLDEIHKYPGWSREIKLIYDSFPSLRLTISGSSLLQILNPEADLSRRCLVYDMPGLSFREYLQFYEGVHLPVATLEQVLCGADELCAQVADKCQPVKSFHQYLQYGYYPYYLEGGERYYERVENVVNYVIGTELPLVCKVEMANVRKLRLLLNIISGMVPYEVDISKLSTLTQMSRNTVLAYLKYLGDAKVISLIYSDLDSLKKMQKPDKIFLENTNLLYALTLSQTQVGTVRETFVVNQLGYGHRIEYSKAMGDFRVDGRYLFEVGGRDKTFDQIADQPDSYVLADDMEFPVGHKLPIWLVGMLY